MSATPLTVLYRLFWNFACIFFMVWGCACGLDVILRLFFFTFFLHCELSHFSPSIYRQLVPREHNSSYNFILIFLELYTCFLHSLKMECAFHIILAIFFVTFLYFVNFVIYWPQMYRQEYLVIATSHIILNLSFWNFAHVFSWVCRSASGLDMIFKLFCHFFLLTLSFS